jgi:hypothetical protein
MILRDIDHRALSCERGDYSRDLRPAEWGSVISLHGSNPESLMSAMGHKQTWRFQFVMSAITPKADNRSATECPAKRKSRSPAKSQMQTRTH